MKIDSLNFNRFITFNRASLRPEFCLSKPKQNSLSPLQNDIFFKGGPSLPIVLIDADFNIIPYKNKVEAMHDINLTNSRLEPYKDGKARVYKDKYAVAMRSDIYTKDEDGNETFNLQAAEEIWQNVFADRVIYSIDEDGKLERYYSMTDAEKRGGVSHGSILKILKFEANKTIKTPHPLRPEIGRLRTFCHAGDICYIDKDGKLKIDYKKVEKLWKETIGAKRICVLNGRQLEVKTDLTTARREYSSSSMYNSMKEGKQAVGKVFFHEADIVYFDENGEKRIDMDKIEDLLDNAEIMQEGSTEDLISGRIPIKKRPKASSNRTCIFAEDKRLLNDRVLIYAKGEVTEELLENSVVSISAEGKLANYPSISLVKRAYHRIPELYNGKNAPDICTNRVFVSLKNVCREKNGNIIYDVKKVEEIWKKVFGEKLIYIIDEEGELQEFEDEEKAREFLGISYANLSSKIKAGSEIKGRSGKKYSAIKGNDIIYFDEEGIKRIDYKKVEDFYKRSLGDKRRFLYYFDEGRLEPYRSSGECRENMTLNESEFVYFDKHGKKRIDYAKLREY